MLPTRIYFTVFGEYQLRRERFRCLDYFTNMSSAVMWFMIYAQLLTSGLVRTSSVASPSPTSQFRQLSVCKLQLGANEQDVINLEPLARKDGYPRYTVEYRYQNEVWNYSFNPCKRYNVPKDNPHSDAIFGDKCLGVSICKYSALADPPSYYTLGIHASAKFLVSVDSGNNQSVDLVYRAIESMKRRSTVIRLVCSKKRTGKDDGLFRIISDSGIGSLHAELHHQCCCVGGCWKVADSISSPDDDDDDDDNSDVTENMVAVDNTANSQGSAASKKGKKDDEGLMLIIIGTLVALAMLVALIGGLCYVKRTQSQIYGKLPGKQNQVKKDFRDYEPSGLAHKKLLPVLEDTMIHLDSLEMCQRLGGGIFGDTHLAKWSEMTVAVKRLTLLVHENQITPEAMKLMKNEVWFLSRQRHKNIVTILGLCLDGKLPSIITEYVVGECLKDFLKSQGRLLSWPHRIRICVQVADGMAFLHSTKPPIIHRDLRCGNIFLLDNDVIKVADFGLIKMLQPIREECPQDDCCCRRTMSACPASIRWTAPELLAHPTIKERLVPYSLGKAEKEKTSAKNSATTSNTADNTTDAASQASPNIITTSCDVYSFAMVMWEITMCHDPFEEIATEVEVMKIVKNGGRPETPPSADMMPQFKELMKFCWDQDPASRPPFKQISTRLKDLASQARAYQKQLLYRQRMQKLLQESNMEI